MESAAPSFPWLHWLHHSSFRIESQGQVIYLDPYKVRSSVPADFIFVTHGHGDHFSPKDIRRLAKPGTVLVCPRRLAGKLQDLQTRAVAPGETFTAGPWTVRAVAAYNRRKPMHPQSHAGLGFILDLPEGRLYHAGDTDLIPDMAGEAFQGIRLALLPVGEFLGLLSPTMGPAQAAQAVRTFEPEFAAPMHFGMLPGSRGSGAAFLRAAGSKALILPEEEPL